MNTHVNLDLSPKDVVDPLRIGLVKSQDSLELGVGHPARW